MNLYKFTWAVIGPRCVPRSYVAAPPMQAAGSWVAPPPLAAASWAPPIAAAAGSWVAAPPQLATGAFLGLEIPDCQGALLTLRFAHSQCIG
jgi:hypothetical protein